MARNTDSGALGIEVVEFSCAMDSAAGLIRWVDPLEYFRRHN